MFFFSNNSNFAKHFIVAQAATSSGHPQQHNVSWLPCTSDSSSFPSLLFVNKKANLAIFGRFSREKLQWNLQLLRTRCFPKAQAHTWTWKRFALALFHLQRFLTSLFSGGGLQWTADRFDGQWKGCSCWFFQW